MIAWEEPPEEYQNGLITNYTVIFLAARSTLQMTQISIETNTTLIPLSPYSTYQCMVAASTSVGIGPFTPTLTFETEEDSTYAHFAILCHLLQC